jgi:hypothetical protein
LTANKRPLTRSQTRDEKVKAFAEMDKIGQLELIRRSEKLMDEIDVITSRYPRTARFGLAKRTQDTMEEFYCLLVEGAKRYMKKSTLQNADIRLYLLKRLIRIAHSRHYISTGQYKALIVDYLLEIGMMLGGWIRSVNEKARA